MPEEDAVREWCQQNNVEVKSLHALYKENAKLKKVIFDQMTQAGVSAGLKSFEQVSA